MIEFQELMQALHKGVQDAAQDLEHEELSNCLDDYFYIVDDKDQAVPDLKPSEHDWQDSSHSCKPKLVPMEFPTRQADNSIKSVTANVPLITLTPMNTSRVKEVTISTELDITSNKDNSLSVAFKDSKTATSDATSAPEVPSSTNTKIEIKLTGNETPEGLKKVIAGYERALRAQIPG